MYTHVPITIGRVQLSMVSTFLMSLIVSMQYLLFILTFITVVVLPHCGDAT